MDFKAHWQNIYATKNFKDVSWFQEYPKTSVRLIEESGLSKDAKIIDIGGGDNYLVDALLELGYTNLTVLDISENAIERAKKRLGEKAKLITWIVSDITEFTPENTYDFWHDRAVFHFLTSDEKVTKYKSIVSNAVNKKSYFSIGTFSENGPNKCSGIEIRKYSTTDLKKLYENHFEALESFNETHPTPFDTTQDFSFVKFRRK